MTQDGTIRLRIADQAHVGEARREARRLAYRCGLDMTQAESVALAVSELCTNLVRYAGDGEIEISEVSGPAGRGVQVETRDEGPGIDDIQAAMQDGYSTGGGLGSGLPAARRMMDEFEITSGPQGTRIVARKWKANR